MEESSISKIKVLESNYFFLQKEHSILIKGLHEEIEKLQRKYSELAFDYTMRADKSLETMLLEDKIKQLQSSTNEKNREIASQKETMNIMREGNKEREVKLLKQIEDQNNTIKSLKEIISERSSLLNSDPNLLEKDEKPRKDNQSEKVHKRKKKKSANACARVNENTGEGDTSPDRGRKSKVLTPKSKSAASSVDITTQKISSSEQEGLTKKGKREKRHRKKNSAPSLFMGDIPVLPSDYRAAVATLPPLSQSHEEPKLECDPHKFIPCSSERHSFSPVKGNVNTLSQLHKGLRKPSVKVNGLN